MPLDTWDWAGNEQIYAQKDRIMNPHILFLGAVEASRLVARGAHSADPAARVDGRPARAAARELLAARFWARLASR